MSENVETSTEGIGSGAWRITKWHSANQGCKVEVLSQDQRIKSRDRFK
jgi:hypothetical protein